MFSESSILECAKSFTEIALQEKLINTDCVDNEKSAKAVATFFNTLVANLDRNITD